jgi:hypothetical protein
MSALGHWRTISNVRFPFNESALLRKQTFAANSAMSAMGHKRTLGQKRKAATVAVSLRSWLDYITVQRVRLPFS